MSGPSYPAARKIADTVREHFARQHASLKSQSSAEFAPRPDSAAIESIIDIAFWASLRREEGFSPKISLAFTPPELVARPLLFEQPLPLAPGGLSHLAPAVERHGLHLGVWRYEGELYVWGTTRTIPRLCFVLEVIEPGLLVVKYRRGQDPGKFVNVLVLKGDDIKVVDEKGTSLPDCPELVTNLLGFGSFDSGAASVNVYVELAASMRAHGRGGSLLVVPHKSDSWRSSIVWPVNYAVSPAYSELAELMRRPEAERDSPLWGEELVDAVDQMAGLTAVDGATIISDQYDLLAFGAKIVRRVGARQVEHIVISEPVIDAKPQVVQPVQIGGTRHFSAAQFVSDQHEAIALVASQDGRFTVFAWSPCEEMVHAHSVETLLL